NTFRMSISWSRLIAGGRGVVNPEAVTFYNNVIDELIANDIEPFVNLFHFDMPLELQNEGGWENREVVDAYSEYAKACFELFGDRVKKWFTFNEPIVPVEGGYLYDFHYPNVVDAKRAVQVAYNTMIAHAKAVEAFRTFEIKDGKIGIILILSLSYQSSDNQIYLKASLITNLFFNRSFLDSSVLGEYPQEFIEILREHGQSPDTKQGDKDLLKAGKADIFGVNYYQPR